MVGVLAVDSPDAGFLHGNLGVLHQLGQVLLANPVLQLDASLVPGGAGS